MEKDFKMRDYLKEYEKWTKDDFFDEEIKKELAELKSEKEIEERFYCELEFGTGGLRGIMGAGTNRMNQYTVGKASAGLGLYLKNKYDNETDKEISLVIGYDTRNNSRLFAYTAANVLTSMGIHVYLLANSCPTPQLSFSVTWLGAVAGIVITASHNPKEYNGYKVYDEYGCQLVPEKATQVMEYIKKITDYHMIKFKGNNELISVVDSTDAFVAAVMKHSRCSDCGIKAELKVVYSPLHGTGLIPVRQVLQQDGFVQLHIVEEQTCVDGEFSTVQSPNPQEPCALEMGIEKGLFFDADIVLGTDPDCDRVGIAVKNQYGNYQLLTGNQIGVLLLEYILDHTDLSTLKNPAVIKTIVTSELGAEIARKRNVTVLTTLTGFKFIGEKITQFEEAKKNGIKKQDYDFIFGYEESHGYLTGTYSRDKDAVVSSMLICEMAAELKRKKKTLIDRLGELYTEYGYYKDDLDSYTLEGKKGMQKISAIMEKMRGNVSPFPDTIRILDFKYPMETECEFEKLPPSNVLKYVLKNGSWIAVRPSGTEPKLKIYYNIRGNNSEQAELQLHKMRKIVKNIVFRETK